MYEGFEVSVEAAELSFFFFGGVIPLAVFVALGDLFVAELFYFFDIRELARLCVDVG